MFSRVLVIRLALACPSLVPCFCFWFTDGVLAALRNSVVLETTFNTLAVRHEVGRTGDTRLGDHLSLLQQPSQSPVLPSYKVEEGRTESQAVFKQEQRVSGNAARQRRGNFFAQGGGEGKARAKPGGRGGGRGRGASQPGGGN